MNKGNSIIAAIIGLAVFAVLSIGYITETPKGIFGSGGSESTQVPTGVASDEPLVTVGNSGTLSAERALTGTSNQVVVTDDGSGTTVTLSTPQSIGTGSSPTFSGLTLTTLTVNGASTLSTSTVQGYLNVGIFVATSTGKFGGLLTTNGGITGIGINDFGGATSFEIVNGASPTVDTIGEIALDTTDNQLLVADSAGTARVFAGAERILFAFVLASTSPDFLSGGTFGIPSNTKDGRDITQFRCRVDAGTSVVVNVSDDGTNDTETITCATTQTSDTDVATNSTFTADELWRIEIGTITGTPDYLIFEAYGYITAE